MRIWMTALAILLFVGGALFFALGPQRTMTITLTFHAKMGDHPLVFDEFVYENPAGRGTFRVRDFRLYLSNLTLSQDGALFTEPDSYHLLRFDNPETTHSIRLNDIPLSSIEHIRFMIGVDPEANGSIQARGDLDPNSQMAWNWEVGYKFVVMEGTLRIGEEVSPLVYHVGFSENAREVDIQLPPDIVVEGDVDLHMNVDVAKLFDGPTQVDLRMLSSVKFNREDAAMLADNYAVMITPMFK
ncbi:MbnP family protein [Ruegeria atlantica]|uniref:MbnP family protein n=1 Tax=Ruegeria atlantica TaxID=81569 RepID=UPI0024942574|nr:MbnP family protein [Ruegeria atlantica]